ncbi:MAG: KH domain-containing protein [Thermoleophilia bacterium]|nr:KH domain-containing protein [Thermoleophilia bacterium]
MTQDSAQDEARLATVLEAVAAAFGVDEARVAFARDEEGGLLASVEGDGAGALVGRNGEVIDAIQYIASQVVGRGEGGRRRVGVDAGGYRARREALLTDLANRAANEAVEFQEEIELDAMTPHDRRIVHMALKERTDVVTRSEGEEPRRRIVVEPAE